MREHLDHEVSNFVKLLNVLILRMPAVVIMCCTLQTSVNVNLNFPIAPIFQDHNGANYLSFFLLILISSIMMFIVCMVLFHILANFSYIIKTILDSIKGINLHLFILSALESQSLFSLKVLFPLLSCNYIVINFF